VVLVGLHYIRNLSFFVYSCHICIISQQLDVDRPGYKANNKFNTNHGALTLGVGYSFGL